MPISSFIKKLQSIIQPIAAWIILASCLGLFFSRQLSLISGTIGITLWLLSSITKKHIPLTIPFIITLSLAFTITLPPTNLDTPAATLTLTIIFWGLTLTITASCLHYLWQKTNIPTDT